MNTIRRLLGCAASLAGFVGVILCVAAIVGCWIAESRFVDWLDRTAHRADTTLATVQENVESANRRLRHTQLELAEGREKQSEPAPPAKPNIVFRSLVERHKPELREAKSKLATATEAGVVVQGMLEALVELNLGNGKETDHLRNASAQVTELIDRADKVTAKLDPVGPVDPDQKGIEEGLDKLVRTLDEGNEQFGILRQQVNEYHWRIRRGALWAAVTITILLLWIGLGQWSLATQGCRWGSRGKTPQLSSPLDH